jgi:hypothetical protein
MKLSIKRRKKKDQAVLCWLIWLAVNEEKMPGNLLKGNRKEHQSTIR